MTAFKTYPVHVQVFTDDNVVEWIIDIQSVLRSKKLRHYIDFQFSHF